MQSTAASKPMPGVGGDVRFFVIMAIVMSLFVLAGFSVNLATGRSSFDVPWPYHLHAVIAMAWLGLYVAQHATIAAATPRCMPDMRPSTVTRW